LQIVRKQPLIGRFADASFTTGASRPSRAPSTANAATGDGKLAVPLNGTWQGTDNFRDRGRRVHRRA
jgi:hypothetical protein